MMRCHNGNAHSNEHLLMLDLSPEEAGVYTRVKEDVANTLQVRALCV